MIRIVQRAFTARHGYAKLALLAAWLFVIKLLAALAFHSAGDSIYDISFGFGGFIESLDTKGVYESCTDGVCTYSTRMPALPLFVAGIGLVTTNLLAAAMIKAVLLSVLDVVVIAYLIRVQAGSDARKTAVWFVIGAALLLSPPVIKHASTIHYEESFLIELLFLWAFAFLVAVQRLADRDATRRDGVMVLALALSAVAYLFKSSMIAVFALTIVLAVLWVLRWHGRRVPTVLLVCLAAMGGWAAHNVHATGHFSVLTSYDGPNSYRGMNSQGAEIYPELYLDRLFDSSEAYLSDGTRVDLPPLRQLDSFDDEWQQNSYYSTLARDWAEKHPGELAEFTAKKAFTFFVGWTRTPITYDADARALPASAEDLVTSAWLIEGRVMWLVLLGVLVALWRRRDRVGRALCLAVVGMHGAYAAPYLVGFGYERHVTTYLVMSAACLGVLATELLQGRATPVTGSSDGTPTEAAAERSA